MKPKRIFLIRHGESEINADISTLLKKPDYAGVLTEKGRAQALEVGKRVAEIVGTDPYMVYSSPYWRTRQTYQLATRGLHAPFHYYEDPRLREQEWGTRLLKNVGALKERENDERDSYGHFYYRFDNGESCADVYHRVSDFINTMHRDFEKPHFPDNVFIFNHGMTIRVFLMRWFHWSVEHFESIRNIENCGMVELLWNPDKGAYELQTPLETYPERRHEYQYDWKELCL